MLKKYDSLFVKFGGHSGACGFTMREENFAELKEGLLKDVALIREETPDVFVKKYPWEMEISPSEATIELSEQVEKLAPFGNGNPKPVFLVKDAYISDVRYMGDEGQHVRFSLKDDYRRILNCVLFNRAGEYEKSLNGLKRRSIAGCLETQIWQGQKRLQLIVENIID